MTSDNRNDLEALASELDTVAGSCGVDNQTLRRVSAAIRRLQPARVPDEYVLVPGLWVKPTAASVCSQHTYECSYMSIPHSFPVYRLVNAAAPAPEADAKGIDAGDVADCIAAASRAFAERDDKAGQELLGEALRILAAHPAPEPAEAPKECLDCGADDHDGACEPQPFEPEAAAVKQGEGDYAREPLRDAGYPVDFRLDAGRTATFLGQGEGREGVEAVKQSLTGGGQNE